RIGYNQTLRQGWRHAEQIFVRFEDERFGNGKNFASEAGAQCEPAGSEVTAAEPEVICVGCVVETERTRRSGLNQTFASIFERFNESVAEHSEGLVGGKNLGDTLKFSRSPPVVAIEKRDDVAAAFWNAQIESGSLSTVFLADQADLRRE